MLRSLKEVQADDSVVGFYQAITLGSFFSQNFVETQAVHQDKLRHGGVVVVHGTPRVLHVVFTLGQPRSWFGRHLADRTG